MTLPRERNVVSYCSQSVYVILMNLEYDAKTDAKAEVDCH